jgi:hypothetical protein
MRMLVALLLVFQTGYVRYHLLTEAHHDDNHADTDEMAIHHDEPDDCDHHDSDQHKPHSASDHLVQLVAKDQPTPLAVHFLSQNTALHLTRPDTMVFRILYERGKAPGESPPDPQQPRAPPLVLIPPAFRHADSFGA